MISRHTLNKIIDRVVTLLETRSQKIWDINSDALFCSSTGARLNQSNLAERAVGEHYRLPAQREMNSKPETAMPSIEDLIERNKSVLRTATTLSLTQS